MEKRQLVIIGTGPAGLTSAIYASRAELKPLVIEGFQPGGQLTTTTEVDNFPGFPNGLQGPQLMSNMKQQAERFGTEFLQTQVNEIDLSKRPFTLTCEGGQQISAEAVIISTGASAKYLGLPEEAGLIGRGVSACATCDGFFYKDKIAYMVGGGDTAAEEALFLTKFAKRVYLVHRRDELRASKPMQKLVLENDKIEMVWNSEVVEILSNMQGVNALKIKNIKSGEVTEHATDGLFVAIGHNPNTEFLKGQLKLDEEGFIATEGKHPDTSVSGVFACGDVQDPYYRQAISAAGSGCQAAIRAERFLSN